MTMTVPQLIGAFVAAASIPSAVTAFCFWLIQQKILKQSKLKEEAEKQYREEVERKEQLRAKQEFLLFQGISASIALGEATARAVQRIPDANCNGDMHEALDYAQKIKHEQKDFLAEQGIHSLFEQERKM